MLSRDTAFVIVGVVEHRLAVGRADRIDIIFLQPPVVVMLVGRDLSADMVGQLIQTAAGGLFVAVALGVGRFATFEVRERECRSLGFKFPMVLLIQRFRCSPIPRQDHMQFYLHYLQ